jgi:hypothetical protein
LNADLEHQGLSVIERALALKAGKPQSAEGFADKFLVNIYYFAFSVKVVADTFFILIA